MLRDDCRHRQGGRGQGEHQYIYRERVPEEDGGQVPITMLSMVDDLLAVNKCGLESVEANAGMSMNINLIQQEIITPEGNSMHFEIGEFHKFCLVNGIDQIDWTLQFEDLILQHEKKVENGFPWLSLKSDA